MVWENRMLFEWRISLYSSGLHLIDLFRDSFREVY